MITEYKLLIEVYKLVENDKVELLEVLSTTSKKYSQFSLSNTTSIATSGTSTYSFFRKIDLEEFIIYHYLV